MLNHSLWFEIVLFTSCIVIVGISGQVKSAGHFLIAFLLMLWDHTPPSPNEMYRQIKMFYYDLSSNTLDPIELAAWTHAEFVKIHPFTDGNGRTSRLIMNYQLMKNGYLPISIDKKDRLSYYEALEEYAVNNNLMLFADMIATLEEQQLQRCVDMTQDMTPEIQNFEQQQNM